MVKIRRSERFVSEANDRDCSPPLGWSDFRIAAGSKSESKGGSAEAPQSLDVPSMNSLFEGFAIPKGESRKVEDSEFLGKGAGKRVIIPEDLSVITVAGGTSGILSLSEEIESETYTPAAGIVHDQSTGECRRSALGSEKRSKQGADFSGLSEFSPNVDNHRRLKPLDDHEGPLAFVEQEMHKANDREESRPIPIDSEPEREFCDAITCNVSPGGEHLYNIDGLGTVVWTGNKNDHITEIKSALMYSSKIENGRQQVRLLFRALKCDGAEVMVDNMYMRYKCPSLLIDFYEKHLKLPRNQYHEPKDEEFRHIEV